MYIYCVYIIYLYSDCLLTLCSLCHIFGACNFFCCFMIFNEFWGQKFCLALPFAFANFAAGFRYTDTQSG